jgi:xylulokinase
MSSDVGAGPLVLTVDLGSTGLKVGYVTMTGSPVWWHQETLVTHYRGGAATQDATDWWERITGAARRGLVAAGLDGQRVVGVGITGQWGSTVPTAADGRPAGDVVMWNDARGVEHSRAAVGGPVVGYAPKPLATWLRRSGGIPNPTGQDPLAHMLHLLRDQPAVAAAARWFLEPVDHLVMRFTGVASASPMSMTGAWLTDNRDLARVAYDDTLVRLSGVDPAMLPPLVPSGSIVGTVRPEVAADLGIAPTAQVVTGAPDLHAAVVGSGCVEPFQAHISIGTTGWITFPVPFKKTDVMHQMASVPGIGDGSYIVANNQDSAGRCLEWFRDTVAGFDGSPPSFEEILAVAASAPPGSRGTLFTPWLTGERSTLDDRNARGGFHNVGIDSGPAELARSVLEGVSFNARMLLGATERFAGRRLDPIRIVGGGARSDLWCQIVADATDRAIDRVEAPMVAGLRGAGLFVAMALGEVSLGDVHDLVPVDRRFTPDPAARDTYDRLFKEFPKLHSRNKRMFAHLNG